MPQISIIVEYETQDGREEEFLALIKDHARRTLFEESGCLRFEVLKPLAENADPLPNKVMVSELYADHTAVIAHNDSARLATVRSALGPLVKSRRLILSEVLSDQVDMEGLTPDQLNASNDG